MSENQLNLAQVQAAYERKSNLLPQMAYALARQARYPTINIYQEGVLTFENYLRLRYDYEFQQLPATQKQQKRQQLMTQLESADAAIALPESLKLHEFLLPLWHDHEEHGILYCLLKMIPFTYGAWRGIKQIFKLAEVEQNWTIYAVILARLDSLQNKYEITDKTAAYLVRRGWRTLRQLSDLQYAQVTAQVLQHYSAQCNVQRSTIVFQALGAKKNHIAKQQIFEHRLNAWQSQVSSLFLLVENAQNSVVRNAAIETLKKQCAAQLRQLPTEQLRILAQRRIEQIDDFVVWLLQNDPRFEQSRLKELGLHSLCINFLTSSSLKTAEYAAAYAKVYGRDLNLEQLLPLLDSRHKAVYQLAQALIAERDPKKDFSFDDWGKMLETEHGYKQASQALITHYSISQFRHEWLTARLRSVDSLSFQFACQLIEQKAIDLSPTDYLNLLLNQIDFNPSSALVDFVFLRLNQIDLCCLKNTPLLQSILLMGSRVTMQVIKLLKKNKIALEFWSLDFLKTFVDDTYWQPDANWAWLAQQKEQYSWAVQSHYSESLVEDLLHFLSDVRSFEPQELGLDWLLHLTKHQNSLLTEFASDYLIKVFRPADFSALLDEKKGAKNDKSCVDLKHQSFLFTGKLATMTRTQASSKVSEANGVNAKSVTKTLNYLVIGDEGSSLYGEGAKGSKEVKAEQLNAKDAQIRIISETAFLQMLVGKTLENTPQEIEAGCEQIWQFLFKKQSVRNFAIAYIQQHHLELSKTYLGRPVDISTNMPNAFFTFERIEPLFYSEHTSLRALGSELANCHLFEWVDAIPALFNLCLHPDSQISSLAFSSFTLEDKAENRTIRIEPKAIQISHLLLLCENQAPILRKLGLYLLQTHSHLQQPNALLGLLESSDAQVRAAIIRMIAKANSSDFALESCQYQNFLLLLRFALFEVPPARGKPDSKYAALKLKLKPLPAREAKRKLLETLRDVAIEQIQQGEAKFAQALMPLVEEFSQSRGKSEFAACIVAQTRINHALLLAKMERQL